MDVEILARLQFAMTVSFHYIYPPLSIGLGVVLVICEGLYLKTKDKRWENMTKFFVKVFALTFGIGVATGIVLEFEFGTNWATYSRYVGDIFGSALAAEGIFAFFLESGFLGVLLFGWNRVGPKVHFLATVMVALGSTFSAVWIVVANSWMHTPAGFHIVGEGLEARAEVTDFWAMVFNPSAMERLAHVIGGAWMAGAFLVTSIAAYYALRDRHPDFVKRSFTVGLGLALFASLFQLATGHISAEGVAENQPAKLAAYEGQYPTGPGDLYLVGWVDEENESVSGIAIPGMLSWMVHGDADEPVTGLSEFKPEDRPERVNAIFQFYHAMVAIGLFLIALALFGAYMHWRGKLVKTRWLLWVFVFAVLGPMLANQIGWFAAEMGRQPWIVYGLLRTSDALSKAVVAEQVLFSIILFGVMYVFLFALFVYLLNKKIKHGPEDASEPDDMYSKKNYEAALG